MLACGIKILENNNDQAALKQEQQKSRTTIGKTLVKLFENHEGQLDTYLLFVFLIVNGLVLFNAIFHEPTIQYDSNAHVAYVYTLAKLHLPSPDESDEFFSPPLPYILPAVAKLGGLSLWWAVKVGQIVNVALSIGITGLLIALCRSARPSDTGTALIALMFLGALPVYYKSMAFVRGEPYVAFLTLAAIAVTARALTFGKRLLADALAPGLCWGLLILARQSGALAAAAGLVVAVSLTALRIRDGHKFMIGLVGSLIALLVGGWFYGWLWMSNGSPIAFNRSPAMQWTLRNQPFDFYTGTGNGRLFADPVRPSFPNQLIPIFYAETWGDYWGYFLIYAKDLASGTYASGPDLEKEPPPIIETNRFALRKYLGRVNLLGLLPTALALVAFGTAAVRLRAFVSHGPVTLSEIIPVIATLVIAVSASGYLWFLVGYPNLGKGDTIKATYMLHIFAPLALLTADLVRRTGVAWRAFFVGWGLLMMHNALAVTTHYIIPVLR